MDLTVDSVGEGETVVLVHGSGRRDAAWSDQLPLAERYRLVLPYRRGYAPSPAADPDFDADGRDVAALLGDRAHLVGHSYGGVASLLAAGHRPEAVRSLTVIEPPAFGVARGNPAVEELIARLETIYDETTPEGFDRAFYAALGAERPYDALDEASLTVAEARMRERPPWEAVIPFERLEGLPVFVVSGAWSSAFDAVCDVIEERLGAERAVLPGAGHAPQHVEGFNERLLAFWAQSG